MAVKVHVLVLAAGSSQRFGSPKQLATIEDKPLINHVLQNYRSGETWLPGISDLSLVLGAQAESICKVIPQYIRVHIAENWPMGMGASLASAMGTIPDDISHVLVGLGDQLAISTSDIAALILKSNENPESIIAASYDRTVGVPAIFPRTFFSKLRSLDNDTGARKILRAHLGELIQISIPGAAIDIDTPEDLRQYLLEPL